MRRKRRKIQTTESPWRGERERDFQSVFSAQIPHQQSTGVQSAEKNKTDQERTHTVAMTHLLFCSRNTNLHALVVWRNLTCMCA